LFNRWQQINLNHLDDFFSQCDEKTGRKITLGRKGFFAIHFQNSL